MRPSEFARQKPVLAAALGGVVLGAVLGLARPAPEAPADAVVETAWVPYGRLDPARFSEREFNTLRGARIWGGAASNRAETVSWTLTGIIAAPAPAALVSVPGKKTVQQVGQGGELPDGGKIVEITSRSIRYTKAGCSYERALYSAPDPAGQSGECQQDAGDDAAPPANRPAATQKVWK